MRPLKLQLGHVIERYVEIERSAQMVKIRHFLTFLPVRSSENDNDHPHLVVLLDIENSTKKKSHISLKNSPRAAESWKRTYLEVWGFLPVNLHFATKLFTAVPNFLGHWMRVPAPYKQTKNETNANTEITAGSCYREVRWNWKVSTNGQNPTFSHLSARSQLRKWQWPSSSRWLAGYRQEHHEKDSHFSKELAQGCWKLKKNLSRSLGLFTRESSLCD